MIDLKELDWPAGELFSFRDEPGDHDPCYIVMPGGAMLPVNHHAAPGVDIARAKFIIAACNAALASPAPVAVSVPEAWELEAAAIFMDHVDDDETGSVHRVAAFLRAVSGSSSIIPTTKGGVGVVQRAIEALNTCADILDKADFGHDVRFDAREIAAALAQDTDGEEK